MLLLQVEIVCCAYYHLLAQQISLSATQKFVAREGGNMRNKQSHFATQHCCATSCTKMLPVLLGLKTKWLYHQLLSFQWKIDGITTLHSHFQLLLTFLHRNKLSVLETEFFKVMLQSCRFLLLSGVLSRVPSGEAAPA